jgi:hypothetical protein
MPAADASQLLSERPDGETPCLSARNEKRVVFSAQQTSAMSGQESDEERGYGQRTAFWHNAEAPQALLDVSV